MDLNLKGFQQLVEDMGAALQSSATALVDVSVGSVARAIFEANASVVLWLQWLVLQVLQTTRASTSTGLDLDSWMMDFGLSRLPANYATGVVTFSRFVSVTPAVVPIGSSVKTSDGSLTFTVIEDNTLSTWQTASSAYLMPAGVTSLDLPISCSTGGASGNVLSGSISVISTSLPGIDHVNNANSLFDGADAETDQAFRMRFQNYLASRSRGTMLAVQNAISAVQQNLNALVLENTSLGGTPQIGGLLIIIDDGSGLPSNGLLYNVATAVEAVRPVGTTCAVIAPSVMSINVILNVEFTSSDTAATGIPLIENLVKAYLNGLPIGKGASITRIAQQAYAAGSNIININEIQANGGFTDIVPSPLTVIKAGDITVIANVS